MFNRTRVIIFVYIQPSAGISWLTDVRNSDIHDFQIPRGVICSVNHIHARRLYHANFAGSAPALVSDQLFMARKYHV